jgi:membrane fusion protein (multidrug efflux system)
MYVRARLTQGTQGNAILLPHAAVSRTPRGEGQAMVVNAGNMVEPRIIKTGPSIGDKWVVTEGLAPGDRVIVEGLQKARPGSPVQAQEAGAAAAAPAAPAAVAK